MPSGIQTYLNNILNAVYGRDVRNSIHDAIEMCYDNVSSGVTLANTAAANANAAASNANAAASSVDTVISSANTAISNANTARNAANNAATSANTAKDAALTAADSVDTAISNANAAATTATTAATNANTARDAANTAASQATVAKTAANNAATSATNAATNATNAATSATNAATTATAAANNADAKATLANTAATNADTATTAANTATTAANNAATAANTAATNANSARDSANTAANAANTAATNATAAAGSATSAVNSVNAALLDVADAISDAATATTAATTAATNANSVISSATTAAERAITAATTIEGLTVSSENVGSSTPASAIIQTVGDHKNIHFVLRQGPAGASFTIKGPAYATVSALEEGVPNPEIGDQYNVGSAPPYNIYRWTGISWEDQGVIAVNGDSITAQDVEDIQNGVPIENANSKIMKVEALTYLLQTTIAGLMNGKVDKVANKGLTSNDFTDALKSKVELIGSSSLDTTAETITSAINELASSRALSNSPVLTGTPTAPTASAGTNTQQLATTAFVQSAVSGYKNVATLEYVVVS